MPFTKYVKPSGELEFLEEFIPKGNLSDRIPRSAYYFKVRSGGQIRFLKMVRWLCLMQIARSVCRIFWSFELFVDGELNH